MTLLGEGVLAFGEFCDSNVLCTFFTLDAEPGGTTNPSERAKYGLMGVGERRLKSDLLGVSTKSDLFCNERGDVFVTGVSAERRGVPRALGLHTGMGVVNQGFSPLRRGVEDGNLRSKRSGLSFGPKDTRFLLLAGDSKLSSNEAFLRLVLAEPSSLFLGVLIPGMKRKIFKLYIYIYMCVCECVLVTMN